MPVDRPSPVLGGPVDPPSATARAAAAERVAALATPAGALGRLGELGAWLAACQGTVPPEPLDDVRLVVLAGDHGVADHGVSAYPAAITAAMVRTVVAGRAGVSALAAAHGVQVRVLDLGIDDDLAGLLDEVSASRVRRGSGAIHLEDALTPAETERALAIGASAAQDAVAGGASLLLTGDLGIGNTTPAAALVAALLGLDAVAVTGRGTGIDDAGLSRKRDVVATALERTSGRREPVDLLAALGSADLAATVGFLVTAARSGVPVLLDGVVSLTCALVAERAAPGSVAWFAAGHRSPEPAQAHALEALGLEPLLDLGLRLGEGSGAVAAVPVLRSAVALLRDVALLADLLP